MEQNYNIDFATLDIRKIRKGLFDYEFIMKNAQIVNISTNTDFKKIYTKFYKVVRVDDNFRNQYFSLFEDAKAGKVGFEDVLRTLYKVSNKAHLSFTTKMFHTLNDSLPISDKYVKQYSQINIYGQGEERLQDSLKKYEILKCWYQDFFASNESRAWIRRFDEYFPGFIWISPIKKIDFIIWGRTR
jgi:hypothetical protein